MANRELGLTTNGAFIQDSVDAFKSVTHILRSRIFYEQMRIHLNIIPLGDEKSRQSIYNFFDRVEDGSQLAHDASPAEAQSVVSKLLEKGPLTTDALSAAIADLNIVWIPDTLETTSAQMSLLAYLVTHGIFYDLLEKGKISFQDIELHVDTLELQKAETEHTYWYHDLTQDTLLDKIRRMRESTQASIEDKTPMGIERILLPAHFLAAGYQLMLPMTKEFSGKTPPAV